MAERMRLLVRVLVMLLTDVGPQLDKLLIKVLVLVLPVTTVLWEVVALLKIIVVLVIIV
jgi:hypothetical protein